jgi:hypothetical protein
MNKILVEPRKFRCSQGHTFDGEILQGAIVRVFIAQLKSLRCPVCGLGWKNVFLTDLDPASGAPDSLEAGADV